MKKYQVYLGVVNYTITLDEEGKIQSLQEGNELPESRQYFNRFGKSDSNRKLLENALRYLLIAEPKKFNELYKAVKENDPEMFEHVNSVVNSISEYCTSLKSEE